MNLIELYTREVGRNLPKKMRVDIEKEIRSLIEDSLDDESQKSGRAVDEAMQVEVLKRLGPPEKVAASYLPPRYLIGPELYPYFLTTLRIVLGVVAVVAALAIGASLGAGPDAPQNAVDLVARLFAGLMDALISAAGTVVLIFAVIQLVSPGFKPETKPQTWDPRKLMAEPDPQRVSIGGTIAEIVFTALALVLFNLYPQWIGLYAMTENGLEYAALLSQAFFRYLPFLNVLWVLEITFSLWLVASGKWSNAQRWTKVGLTGLSIIILAWMLVGPTIVALSAEDLTRLGWNTVSESLPRANEGLQTLVRVTLGIIIALQVVDLGKQLYQMFRQRLPAQLISTR